jgi:hypothetical protein
MRSAFLGTLGLFLLSGSATLPAKDKPAAQTWAWQTPTRPMLPKVKHADWVRNPIDAFIAAGLEKNGLIPGAAADRLTLIRRLSFDLTGLPPTPQEIDVFLKDNSKDAYDKLVDRLLASPRYGERWAMFWLDLVRYAESDGFRADDVRPHAWRYRDYVINAFNKDKPYDRFLQEQLAGDELFPGDTEALIATAFNQNVPYEFNARNLEQRRQEILNDMTDTTTSVFLGVTVGCARCHDHKYDPISQRDYYRFQSFFAGYWARDAVSFGSSDKLQDHEARLRQWRDATAALRKKMDQLEEPVRQKLVDREKYKFPREVREAWETPSAQRTPYQMQLADLLDRQLQVKTDAMTKAMTPAVKKEWQELHNKMADYDKLKPQTLPVTMAITDIGPTAPATYVLKRGNWNVKGDEVQPGFFELHDKKPAEIPPPAASARTTGRRSALARWLTDSKNPLTARVMVNRLWQHHFGKGIVGTPSDFGILGEQPTHPELLDWLAREFIERGWSLKAMHKLMVTSATYQQSSRFNERAAKIDPENQHLWRMNRRRLEGEALRDAMLSASGLLNLKAGGPSIYPELPAEINVPRGGWPVSADINERNRRSIYVFVKRNLRYPFFSTFDAPDSNETCARRHVSTSAPQALMLLNSKITLDMARSFAGRVLNEGGEDGVIDRVYRYALGRTPTEQERNLSADFLAREKLVVQGRLNAKSPVALPVLTRSSIDNAFAGAVVDFCHVVMNLNEFAYVD